MFFLTKGKANSFLYINAYRNLITSATLIPCNLNTGKLFSLFFTCLLPLSPLWLKLSYCIEPTLSSSDSLSPSKYWKDLGNSQSIIKHWIKILSRRKKCFITIKSENRFVLHSLCNAKHLCYLKLVIRLSDVCVYPSCLFWSWGENEYHLSLI